MDRNSRGRRSRCGGGSSYSRSSSSGSSNDDGWMKTAADSAKSCRQKCKRQEPTEKTLSRSGGMKKDKEKINRKIGKKCQQ